MLMKLMKRNLPVVLIDILENWLKNCSSVVKWDCVLSYTFAVKFGVIGRALTGHAPAYL